MNVPFFENPDSTHCFQAIFRMILKDRWPGKDFTWQELEKITAKREGLWTWPIAGMLWLADNGFSVRNVELFDYEKFANKGEDYLFELLGDEVARASIEHSDIPQEIGLAKQIAARRITQSRTPSFEDIKAALDEGNLVICNVNSKALNGKPGYTGHFVLLTDYNDEGFIMHDPGPPGHSNRLVDYGRFEQAWAYPDDKAKNYIAIK